jgi:hypothetical protein
MHILLQPLAADKLFGDPVLSDQGMISRVLATRHESAAGTRQWAEMGEAESSAMSAFNDRMNEIIRAPLPLARDEDGKDIPNELELRRLPFSPEARALWIGFVNDVERRMAPGGEYESIKGLANKLGEHAGRLAATLALFDDLKVAEISGEQGRQVMGQKLLEWLHASGKTVVPLREFYQFGPRPIRDKDTALKAMGVLEAHGWVIKPAQP